MDDEEIAVFVSAAHNAHMGVPGIKHQIPRQGRAPGHGGAVGMLAVGAAAPAQMAAPAACVVEYPIDESRAIQPEGPVGAGAGAAGGRHLHGGPPAGIPAQGEALDSDR